MSDRKEAESAAGGLGFGGALTLLFVGLKLTGYIGWSWWWVLSPLWLGAAGVVADKNCFETGGKNNKFREVKTEKN